MVSHHYILMTLQIGCSHLTIDYWMKMGILQCVCLQNTTQHKPHACPLLEVAEAALALPIQILVTTIHIPQI